jgi:hypothetical protein
MALGAHLGQVPPDTLSGTSGLSRTPEACH